MDDKLKYLQYIQSKFAQVMPEVYRQVSIYEVVLAAGTLKTSRK